MVHKPIITHFLPIYECKPLTRVVCLFTSVGNAEISLSAEAGFVVVCRVYQNTGFLKSHSWASLPSVVSYYDQRLREGSISLVIPL